MTSTPAGWYPTPDGRLRYWDGTGWTGHFAPVPTRSPAPPTVAPAPGVRLPTGRPTAGLAVWLGWGGLLLSALLGVASSGVGGLFSITGVYVLVVAIVALVRGHVDWARIRGRAGAGVALGAAVTLFMVGGATATPTDSPPAAESPAPSTPSLTPTTPTASASPSVSPTPTPTPTPSPTSTTPSPQTADEGTALAAVAALLVKGRAPKTGYSRDEFGHAWYDADRNGCDTRNDVLRRDLENFTLKAGTNGCLVLSGTLVSPYTADTVKFVRGTTTSTAVQIDHVVALSDAWQKGAQKLTRSARTGLANDPLNLLAVERRPTRPRATATPPPGCPRTSATAAPTRPGRWRSRSSTTCGPRPPNATRSSASSRPVPRRSCPPASRSPWAAARSSPSHPNPNPAPTRTTSDLDPHFDTCGEANDAGYGPYVSGKDPEYDWYQDRDHDGIVCER